MELSIDTCNNMDKSCRHYAVQKNLDTKECTPDVSIYVEF